jgi:hypothetical protein
MNGLGECRPGIQEADRFREDVYLRIVATVETMARILDGRAEAVLSSLRKTAAAGLLHEDREAVEMEKVYDSIEHSRFTYNWAHVMLTTRVLDALKTLLGQLVGFPLKSMHSDKGAPSCARRSGEIPRLAAEFADRFEIDFSKCPSGDSFLEGMVLARNKIVHNGAMAWEASSSPDAIVIEGTDEWSPSKCDRDFATRFPEYIDGANRITVSEELFKTNVERTMAFVTWVGERLDSFVQLLTKPSVGHSPS